MCCVEVVFGRDHLGFTIKVLGSEALKRRKVMCYFCRDSLRCACASYVGIAVVSTRHALLRSRTRCRTSPWLLSFVAFLSD
jgi:hypothetical protein